MICYLQKPSGWWKAAAFHQPLLSLSPTKNVNYTADVVIPVDYYGSTGRYYGD